MQAMIEHGVSQDKAKESFFIADEHGLIGKERLSKLSRQQAFFARDIDGGLSLQGIVEKYKPTILLGLTTVGGLFREKLIRAMAINCERPIIFPLSNPTIKAECTAEQAYEWTDGKCIFASGSPFDPVELSDGRIFTSSQCNNMYVFPGLGLGVTQCGAKVVSDKMLYIAAEALAKSVTDEEFASGRVFPHINRIRDVSHDIAVAIVKQAAQEGQVSKMSDKDLANVDHYINEKMYNPIYAPLIERREVTI